jgi:hypothetical protein
LPRLVIGYWPPLAGAWDAEEEALAVGDIERAVESTVSAWVRPKASEEFRRLVLENLSQGAASSPWRAT